MDLPSRAPTSQVIAERLVRAIHEHRLAPGTKLGEDEIGAIYGVSRTIVRAALQALTHDHLVEIERHRGAFVAQPDLGEAREVFEARALIEPQIARLAAARAGAPALARLRQHLAGEHEALRSGDRGRALSLSGQFHLEIAAIAGQTTLAGIVRSLVARSSLVIALYWRRDSAFCESGAHQVLTEALARGDGAVAEAAMLEHIEALRAALDLHPPSRPARSLREALAGD